MRLLKNPTKLKKNQKPHTPQSHFQYSLFKKGTNPSASRGEEWDREKLMDVRQPDFPTGGRRKEKRYVKVSW